METWGMIKELTENPEKEFECEYGKAIKFGDKIIWAKNGRTIMLDHYTLMAKWQEAKEPVTFMEALVEYYQLNKTIVCELDDSIYRFQGGIDTKFYASQIMRGKWYIED